MTPRSRPHHLNGGQHGVQHGGGNARGPAHLLQLPTCSSHRLVVSLLVLCVCASFTLVWRPALVRGPRSFATSLSGHSYHPKLCSSTTITNAGPSGVTPSSSSSSSSAAAEEEGAAGPCAELHDPQLAAELVQMPAGLQQQEQQLRSGDAQIANLQHLLEAAVKQQWPLPLARRLVSLLLQGAVPPVPTGSSSSSSSSQQEQQRAQHSQAAPSLSAAESGHAAGWGFATQAVSLLKEGSSSSSSQLVPCSFDPSLPTDFHTRFVFAAAWPAGSIPGTLPGSSSAALANTVLQLLSTVALLPPGYAFISLSVPAEAAADSLLWLDLLQLLAAPLGVPVHIAVVMPQAQPGSSNDTATVTGQDQRHQASTAYRTALSAFFPAWHQAPTAATATAAAAEPAQHQEAGQLELPNGRKLQQQQQLGGSGSTPSTGPSSSSSSSSTSSSSSSGRVTHGSCLAGAPSPSCYAPEFVVLLEPKLFFCAGDLVRLMEYPEDLVCGLTLDEHKPLTHHRNKKHKHSRRRAAARKLHQQQQQPAAAVYGSGVQEGPMAAAVSAAGQAVLKPEVPPEFELHSLRAAYDAAREVTGELLSTHSPYFSHGASLDLVRAGLPVPVYCCWGGVAKLRAGPLAAGLRFRGGEEGGECHPPDALSLLCDDLWRTGNSRILLDPGVRTSSQLRTKSLFEDPRFPFFYYTENWETTAWFDIHPMLPLQYWNNSSTSSSSGGAGAAAAVAAATTTSSSSDSLGDLGPENANDDSGAAGGDVAEDKPPPAAVPTAAAAAGAWPADTWQPGQQQMCCEGQQWSWDGGQPNHPTDCRRVSALAGKNFTAVFLQRCAAAGLHHRQGSGLGAECG